MEGMFSNLYAFDWSRDNPWLQGARVLLLVLPLLMLVPGLIWWERRLLSWMQDRFGPNRVGPFGLLQTICDGVKLFFKEDITPIAVDKGIYFVAPAIALFPAFALGATMPWGPTDGNLVYRFLTPVADVPIGILYMMAVSSLGVYGIVLGGYASNNKYSLLGGLRSSAQLISYELAMGVSLACIVLATGSLRMSDMVLAQQGPLWGVFQPVQNWFIFTPYGFLAGCIFLICMIAETNRAPFDLPEAENELIAGYHTEYSSMKFAVYFMGEYAAMFVFSGIFAAVFLGGWNPLPIRWDAIGLSSVDHIFRLVAPLCFLGKMAGGLSVYIWLRATLPRLRYDQLMNLGWKSLLPLAAMNLMGVATWEYISAVYGPSSAIIPVVAAFLLLILVMGIYLALTTRKRTTELTTRTVNMVDPSPKRAVELVEPAEVAS